MKRNHLLSIITVLCLLAASAAFAQDGPSPGGGPGAHSRGGMERYKMRRADVMKELDLTDAQRTKLAEIRDRQMRKGIHARADLSIAGLDLRKLIQADKPDQRAIDSQVDRIATLRATQRKSQIAAMLEMRSVLTDEQRQKLKDLRGGMRRGGRMGMGMGMGMNADPGDDDEDGVMPGWGDAGALEQPEHVDHH